MKNKLEYIESQLDSIFMNVSQKNFEVYFDEYTEYFYVKILNNDLYSNDDFLSKSIGLEELFFNKYFGSFLSFIYPQSVSIERGELISVVVNQLGFNDSIGEDKFKTLGFIEDENEFVTEPYNPITVKTSPDNNSTFQMAA